MYAAPEVTVETPEHFELAFELAGPVTRMGAYLIDKLVQVGVIVSLVAMFLLLRFIGTEIAAVAGALQLVVAILHQWFVAIVIILYGAISIGYFIMFEYAWSGVTPGKQRLGIRVIRTDARPLTLLDSVVRNVLRWIDILGETIPIGFLVMLGDSKNRRLGDFAAGTLVVVSRETEPLGLPMEGTHKDPCLDVLQPVVMSMTVQDYKLISGFLARREGLDENRRCTLARRILTNLLVKVDVPFHNAALVERTLEDLHKLYMKKIRVL